MRAREGKLGEKGGRLGGTSLILVQTKVSDPTGPLLTIQEDWANAHIHFFYTKKVSHHQTFIKSVMEHS